MVLARERKEASREERLGCQLTDRTRGEDSNSACLRRDCWNHGWNHASNALMPSDTAWGIIICLDTRFEIAKRSAKRVKTQEGWISCVGRRRNAKKSGQSLHRIETVTYIETSMMSRCVCTL